MMRRCSLFVSCLVAILFSQLCGGQPPTSQTATYKAVADIAKDICLQPQLYGFTKTTTGSVSGNLNLNGLAKKLLDVGLKANVDNTNSNWQGVLQKDAADALKTTDGCRQDMFKAMISKLKVSPDTSIHNRPLTSTQKQAKYSVEGHGPEFSPPKMNLRTLDGCMITPDNPGGNGCSTRDTQTIAAEFCKIAGYLSSETYRTRDIGVFNASYKLTWKVSPDGGWHYVWMRMTAAGTSLPM